MLLHSGNTLIPDFKNLLTEFIFVTIGYALISIRIDRRIATGNQPDLFDSCGLRVLYRFGSPCCLLEDYIIKSNV